MNRQGVGMDQRGKCVHGWGFDLRRGMNREVGIRFVARRDEGWFLGVMALRQLLDGMEG